MTRKEESIQACVRKTNLLKQLPKTQTHHPLRTLLIHRPGITRYIKPRHPNPPRRPRNPNALLEHHIRDLFLLPILPLFPSCSLIAHCIDAPIDHLPAIALDDLFYRVAVFQFTEIDAFAAGDFLCGGETLGNAVDDEDAGCAAEGGGVGGHETDGAGTEDGD